VNGTIRKPAREPTERTLVVRVWLLAFAYSGTCALLVQLVILPYILPAWHGGNGLLAGGDWITFHQLATNRAQRIRAEGWSAFELRPRTNLPIGIASAIYAITWPKPWTLIPLNAALHATAAAALFHVLRRFVADWRWAAIGTVPFVVYPTSLLWVSQIHKDGFFIAGYLCLFAAWVDLVRDDPTGRGCRLLAPAVALLAMGFGFVWLARPDQVVVTEAAAGAAACVFTVTVAARVWRDPSRARQGVAAIALVILAMGISAWLAPSRLALLDWATMPWDPVGHSVGAPGPLAWSPSSVSDMNSPRRGVGAIPWYRTEWSPISVDRLAYRIALLRERYLVFYLDSLSNIDVDVGFYRATDLLRYLPRALQVGLFAPFPTQWRQMGSLTWTTATRRVVAIEMLGVYAALLALPAVVWRWRRRPELWVVVVPCLTALIIYTLAIPNLGALHRFRYGFLMVLVGFGVAGGLDIVAALRTPRANARREPKTQVRACTGDRRP
jgi:hypothetical protein